MQAWRTANPGYWRGRRGVRVAGSSQRSLDSLLVAWALPDACQALQDSWPPDLTAIIGLISRLRGTTLHDIIADEFAEVMLAGSAILESFPRTIRPQSR